MHVYVYVYVYVYIYIYNIYIYIYIEREGLNSKQYYFGVLDDSDCLKYPKTLF